MSEMRTGRRPAAWFSAFMAAAMVAASAPTVGWAQQQQQQQQQGAAAKGPKAPASTGAANKKPTKAGEDDPKRIEARQQFEDAETKLAAGDFAGAYTGYKAAQELAPAPIQLFKMAVALDKAGKAEEAIQAYGAYVAASGSDDAKASEAQSRITELKRSLPIAVTVRTSPPGASVTIDGQPASGVTPFEVKLTAGTHAFHFSLAGYEAFDRPAAVSADAPSVDAILTRSAPAMPAGSSSASAASADAQAAAPGPDLDREHRSNTTGYVLLGVTAACLGVGTIFGIKALQAKDDFDNGRRTADQADTVEQYALVSDLVFGTALTLGVTGAVLLVSNASANANATRAQAARSAASRSAAGSTPGFSIVPSVGPHHATAAARIQF